MTSLTTHDLESLLAILEASEHEDTREHAKDLRARYPETDRVAAIAAALAIDNFDSLTDEEIIALGGIVLHTRVWSQMRSVLGDFRLVALCHAQARRQAERLTAFVAEHGSEWTVLAEEANRLALDLGPEQKPERRPHLRLVEPSEVG
jgi:hypothetical protein